MVEPGIIRKLDEDVVNRIAAGEIVQRPSNALKELIENSLDAHATNIIITVKAGGLKYLQIQDNGTGIRHDNLDIVCERFTTSKLQQYEDLQEISTYGFRGEALASISYISHLTILTKTANDKCAYKASYENGKLKGPIKACAGNNGTQITVEDLFYNVIARKKSLRSPTEEYSHIMEVVGGYAIHNSHVGFTLKKFGENTDIKTAIKSTVVENIRIIHGNSIARELLEIELKDETLKMSMQGFITNVNYSHKRGTMLLFINHRLVDSQSIRKAVDSVYSTYLPKNSHSYVYLSIVLDPRNVDVNVHPTKHEVQFLYEEQIIDRIKSCIEAKLLSCNSSRVMYTQARLPGATMVDEIIKKTTDGAKIYAKDLVRVSSDTQKIDKFFQIAKRNENETINTEKDEEIKNKPVIQINDENTDVLENSLIEEPKEIKSKEKWNLHTGVDQGNITYIDPKESFKTRTFKYERVETKLTSVKQLRMDVEGSCNMNLREILANLIFIACIDCHQSLIQHSTKLYLCNTTKLTEELFYETLLYDFQNLGLIKLSNPLPLEDLMMLGLKTQEAEWNSQYGEMSVMAKEMTVLLVTKKEMLFEYFSLEISADGELLALPLLLDGHTPFMGALPTYLVRLVTEVNWDSEKECFDTFCRQTAIFYSQPNPDTATEAQKSQQWKQEHVIFPAIRRNFLPPNRFVTNGVVLQIANLSDLYKVFERC
ncbi:PREDICTED: DNA mismatch repair protein Mlh1 [Papilio polytes]|uniref:DNA mismatch repair protein Mlh1 n=1 Tax=Papilio polytes TaxID=76194 RepID=UPI00067693A3|nr:PREDICTED: DNA mismatch repair protein Mlh1 [Papilio polytes]